ncbi:nuclear transport factor 2 family protein [Phytoactinopolyspora limicola]|uniref:nuclear transport factor 2 family protein n=1 Tax=Phytoactinopolyspora limicola TaxID=2715536 RepID=UPI0014079D19|nr:nuclear transport factor 2 family protein [Phytoactinopolyspora limicola]
MTDFAAVVARYIDVWNEADADARQKLADEVFAPAVTYIDPMATAASAQELTALIGAVRGQFQGMRFGLHGSVDGHHNQARFQWTLGPAGAEPLVIGFDVIQLDSDGRVATVLGFLDQVPSA